MPDEFEDGQRVSLDDAQMHRLAHYVEQRKLGRVHGDVSCDTSLERYAPHDEVPMERLHELEVENAALRATNASLNRTIETLLERLHVADEALRREQMQARGFWHRLGQKLLGDGRKS